VGLVLTRQELPILDAARIPDDASERGAYVLEDPDRPPDVTFLATSSKVHRAPGGRVGDTAKSGFENASTSVPPAS
jgi:transketolase